MQLRMMRPVIICEDGQIIFLLKVITKINVRSTRDIAPKCGTSGGFHLRGLAPGQHSY